MRYFIVAGERSGDLHASNLVKALKSQDSDAVFAGFGGDYMAEAGVEVKVHIRELAFMGFLEIVKGLFKILGFLKICKSEIESFKPDVIILVDYGGFNMKIAKWAKENGIRVFYYISPKVWAWNTSRAWKLKKTVDKMFSILPFEKAFFMQFDDWDVDYVGNPVVDAVMAHNKNDEFMEGNNLPKDKPLVALLPGSRKQELKYILPTMLEVADKFPDCHFCVAGVKSLDLTLYDSLKGHSNISLIFDQTYDLYSNASAGIITSGTATLETALFELPQVVAYRGGKISYAIAKLVAKVKYISLVNLIMDKQVVKEYIQEEMTVQNLSRELELLLDNNSNERLSMKKDYIELKNILGSESASVRAAKKMYGYLIEKVK
ncbi:lipid-A-disaccharide synthase [Aureibacter tunicatorum]|uniref:Lipid-A-disaccharide synthase n=1 Tax=Aureibacter tunicatorum TaxID=866807 RepID=A0AAE4BUK8_9BACT|nr:lipid-A-disaccharide synthase [Aureibacter tunicatorum]MDR6240882.1 lipid-A-disaccharide synthase [Aureibacter tunicatorum]BDD03662.1 lipid-A-disaccharide synthase [Aureibacter tunicatorum]